MTSVYRAHTHIQRMTRQNGTRWRRNASWYSGPCSESKRVQSPLRAIHDLPRAYRLSLHRIGPSCYNSSAKRREPSPAKDESNSAKLLHFVRQGLSAATSTAKPSRRRLACRVVSTWHPRAYVKGLGVGGTRCRKRSTYSDGSVAYFCHGSCTMEGPGRWLVAGANHRSSAVGCVAAKTAQIVQRGRCLFVESGVTPQPLDSGRRPCAASGGTKKLMENVGPQFPPVSQIRGGFQLTSPLLGSLVDNTKGRSCNCPTAAAVAALPKAESFGGLEAAVE